MNEHLKSTIGLLGRTAEKHFDKLSFCQLIATIIRPKGDPEELYFWSNEKFNERLLNVDHELSVDFHDDPFTKATINSI
jgi:hypothetical protein